MLGIVDFPPDRLAPEADGFQQRPFAFDQADADAPNHAMNDFPAFVRFTTNPAQTQTSFGLLAPSIALAPVVDVGIGSYLPGTLRIVGSFGSDPRPDPDSGVTVGGLDCPVQADGWKPDEIVCDLPSDAAGDVVVTVRRHASNKARLTKWNAAIRYTIQGDDTLQATITYRGAFRADVRKFRPVVHLPPADPTLATSLIPDESSASYECSGRAVFAQPGYTLTITWEGSGTVPAARFEPLPANSFLMTLEGASPVRLGITYGSDVACRWTVVQAFPDGTTFTDSGTSPLPGASVDLGRLPVEPDDPSLPAGFRTFLGCATMPSIGQPHCRLEWDRMVATYPPDPDSAR
jgi:hypothetical protein